MLRIGSSGTVRVTEILWHRVAGGLVVPGLQSWDCRSSYFAVLEYSDTGSIGSPRKDCQSTLTQRLVVWEQSQDCQSYFGLLGYSDTG